ncbi:hypothetical protein [Variovorax sp. R-27]|jgi:hypothetical protein|uniref:hypothetical protein n=1 Tax=Variovorax sp. R-27 TaxID=3404058 RepID=UPI003CE6E42D
MSTTATRKPALRLVPKPQGTIDADMVAFTVMEHIDTEHPTLWETLPRTARVGLRNAIVRAVMAEDAKR